MEKERVTESQNRICWKGYLEVIYFKHLIQTG